LCCSGGMMADREEPAPAILKILSFSFYSRRGVEGDDRDREHEHDHEQEVFCEPLEATTHACLPRAARIESVFLLSRSDLPEQPDKLAKALEDGLRVFISRTQPMVAVRGDNVYELDAISVDLSGARVDFLRRPARPQLADTKPALSACELSVQAIPLSVFGSELSFQLHATDVELAQAKQADDKLLLILHRAASGEFRIEASRAELEKLLARGAEKLARKQGVTIEDLKLTLTQPGPRVLNANVTVAARKLLFRPVLDLSGTISISDELIATVSNLKCDGDGAIAALACAAIVPQFRRVEAHAFPLAGLPLGEVQLHDVALDLANDRVLIAANFGGKLTSG
jgi:hypothetical protein